VDAADLLRKPLPPFDELLQTQGLTLVRGFIAPAERAEPPAMTPERWPPPAARAMYSTDQYDDHMTIKMTATEAKAKFLALLDQAAAGQEIEISKHGRTVARLVPALGARSLKGVARGIAQTSADDDQLLSMGERWNAS
jgi:prevent-host-death family protein